MKDNNTVLYLRGVPPKLKKAFKHKCTDNNISMTQAIIALMESYLLTEQDDDPGRLPKTAQCPNGTGGASPPHP